MTGTQTARAACRQAEIDIMEAAQELVDHVTGEPRRYAQVPRVYVESLRAALSACEQADDALDQAEEGEQATAEVRPLASNYGTRAF